MPSTVLEELDYQYTEQEYEDELDLHKSEFMRNENLVNAIPRKGAIQKMHNFFCVIKID